VEKEDKVRELEFYSAVRGAEKEWEEGKEDTSFYQSFVMKQEKGVLKGHGPGGGEGL